MSIQMPYQPDEEEQAVLDVLARERRANPLRIREETGLRKQYVNDALKQLMKAELVEKVTSGLYAYAGDDPRADGEPESPESLDAAWRDLDVAETEIGDLREQIETARTTLDDLEAALERGDRATARQALDRARDALEVDR